MKHYILCDDYSDYREITDEKGLKQLLFDEINTDNWNLAVDKDFDSWKTNISVLNKLLLDDYNFNYIKEELQSYGWYVQDLWDLQRDLSNFQTYKHGSGNPCIPNDCIEETLKMIDREMR